jgi:hypothetical protein
VAQLIVGPHDEGWWLRLVTFTKGGGCLLLLYEVGLGADGCIGQLMGFMDLQKLAHMMFFLFSFFGLVLLDYISIFFYFSILLRRRLALRLTV